MTTKISADNLSSGLLATITAGGGPKITTIEVTDNSYTVLDDTAVDIAGGYIRITGTGFASSCQVLINNTPATSTTFVSATEVRAQVPAAAAGTGTNSTDLTFTTQPTYIGYGGEDYFAAFNGYIDDLRVTRGVARYTTNFTPPTLAVPVQ